MRTRGEMLAYLPGAAGPSIWVDVAVGFALVPEGTGTTVLWFPITDANAPWLYYERFSLAHDEKVTDVIGIPDATSFRKTIDVKAMRIVRGDMELQAVFEQATLGTAGAVDLTAAGRFLMGAH